MKRHLLFLDRIAEVECGCGLCWVLWISHIHMDHLMDVWTLFTYVEKNLNTHSARWRVVWLILNSHACVHRLMLACFSWSFWKAKDYGPDWASWKVPVWSTGSKQLQKKSVLQQIQRNVFIILMHWKIMGFVEFPLNTIWGLQTSTHAHVSPLRSVSTITSVIHVLSTF
jgi:hypothetical protein